MFRRVTPRSDRVKRMNGFVVQQIILIYYIVISCCGALYLLFWLLPTQSMYTYCTLKDYKTHNDEMQEQPTLQHSTKTTLQPIKKCYITL
jgi:hypothetical protein